jgi:hypothetical protein
MKAFAAILLVALVLIPLGAFALTEDRQSRPAYEKKIAPRMQAGHRPIIPPALFSFSE